VKSKNQSCKTNQKRLTRLKNICALSLLAGSMILLMPATALGNNKSPAPDLFDDFGVQQAADKVLPIKAAKGKKGKHRSIHVHTDLLWSDALTLNLFDDVIVTAMRDRMIDKVKGHSTWIGHVEGEPDSEVFLTIHGNTMSGNVQIGDKTYEIEPKGNNQHDITQVDSDKNPKHSHSKQPEDFLATGGQIDTTPTASASPATSAATAGTVIDVLVVYTPQAKNNASGQAGIEAKITNAVAMANQAYINSKIDMQINLVGMAETNYVETGNMSTSLTDLTGTGDGKMDEVHSLRNQLGADQVALVTADTSYCGYSWGMDSSWISSAFAPYAFSIVHDDSVYACLSNQTFAHELGHVQGDQHNIEDASGTGAYSYSYGYRLCQTGGLRTVMSYECTGGTRVSYFSNPNVSLTTGEVTGSATANNAKSMTNTKAIVAAFRSAAVTLPGAPGSLSASALSSSQIALAWLDKSSNETGFRLERSVDGTNWSEFAVVGSNVTSFTDTGLTGATSYQYRARAYNSAGNSSYSNIGAATTGSGATTSIAVIDTTAPVVRILNPAADAKVSGTVAISVNASDNVGVNSLKLYIDGKLVSSGSTSFLSYNWNTKRARAGVHTISTQAIDLSSNIGSQSISVAK